MLMRTDPFRDLDRLTQQVFGATGTPARPSAMPMDAWREGDTFVVEFDLPGVEPDRIDLDVERKAAPGPLDVGVESPRADGFRSRGGRGSRRPSVRVPRGWR